MYSDKTKQVKSWGLICTLFDWQLAHITGTYIVAKRKVGLIPLIDWDVFTHQYLGYWSLQVF